MGRLLRLPQREQRTRVDPIRSNHLHKFDIILQGHFIALGRYDASRLGRCALPIEIHRARLRPPLYKRHHTPSLLRKCRDELPILQRRLMIEGPHHFEELTRGHFEMRKGQHKRTRHAFFFLAKDHPRCHLLNTQRLIAILRYRHCQMAINIQHSRRVL